MQLRQSRQQGDHCMERKIGDNNKREKNGCRVGLFMRDEKRKKERRDEVPRHPVHVNGIPQYVLCVCYRCR
jgi:hypothetical protein